MDWSEGFPLAVWALAHALGIFVALLTRIPFDGRAQALLHYALPAGLIMIGMIALVTDFSASLGWVTSGATLGVMVVAAVWEPVPSGQDARLTQLIAAHDAA